jgi:hypothetical protein
MHRLNFVSLLAAIALFTGCATNRGPLGPTHAVISGIEESRHGALQGWADQVVKKEQSANALPEPARSEALRKLQSETAEVGKAVDTYLEAKALAATFIEEFDPENGRPEDLKARVNALLTVSLNSILATINRFK